MIDPKMIPVSCIDTGYWEVLHGLAEQRNLAAFERCPSLVACLAESGQYKLLACALCQVSINVPNLPFSLYIDIAFYVARLAKLPHVDSRTEEQYVL